MASAVRPPPISRDHHVGTDAFPYKLSDPARVRRRALLRPTALSIKRRIGLIRVYHRNSHDVCRKLTADMLWLDREYLGNPLGSAFTSRAVCS
jgi:hypothetical protein